MDAAQVVALVVALVLVLTGCGMTAVVGGTASPRRATSVTARAPDPVAVPDPAAVAAAAVDVPATSAGGAAAPAVTTTDGSLDGGSTAAAVTTTPMDTFAAPVAPDPAAPAMASPAEPSVSGGMPCSVTAVHRELRLDAFYTQVCVVAGLPVVASPAVSGAALVAAGQIVQGMLSARPDLARAMAARGFRLGVIGTDQRAVELPEYRDLPFTYPETDWDAARAYGATPRRPLAAAPEENLLCSAADTYPGQSVLVHELGHSVLDMAVVPVDPSFEARIRSAYQAATTMAVYRDTYAMTNIDEYWAEGVQDFFNASRAAYGRAGGGDGYDGPVHDRASLRQADPVLYGLIVEVFTEVDWQPTCP